MISSRLCLLPSTGPDHHENLNPPTGNSVRLAKYMNELSSHCFASGILFPPIFSEASLMQRKSPTRTHAADNDMLQDLCVADLTSSIKVNGYACKPTGEVNANDFSFSGILKPASTNNTMGCSGILAIVENVPGLNTLGISMERSNFAPGGITPVQTHPRATEMIFVLEGQLDVGFITTANKHITKTVTQGEVFVFPKGLLHYLKNKGDEPAAVLAAYSSQSPGVQLAVPALFAADPAVPDDVLTRNFHVGTDEIQKIKEGFAPRH